MTANFAADYQANFGLSTLAQRELDGDRRVIAMRQ
jgi:hypothetical protein